MAESPQTRLKRLRLRSMRRGIKEMDLLLSAFSAGLDALDDADIALYDRLLSESDLDILAWVTGQTPVPAPYAALIARIAATPVAATNTGD
jgi:antitoxin CptB